MTLKKKLLHIIETTLRTVSRNLEQAKNAKIDSQDIELYIKVISYLKSIEALLPEKDIAQNHFQQLSQDVNIFVQYYNHFWSGDKMSSEFIKQFAKEIFDKRPYIKLALEKSNFNLEIFSMLGFFNSNIVAIGANGSGKTSLSEKIKEYLPANGVVISAQKLLIIPTFSGISNFEQTEQALQKIQNAKKDFKKSYNSTADDATSAVPILGVEFMRLLNNLLAERSAIGNKYLNEIRAGQKVGAVPKTKLDQTLEIWNSLIQHRRLDCDDGINLKVYAPEGIYPAFQMSDGEKVILYLIAQVLQAPTNGFIIADEPEMFLHKTILQKLWDVLESARHDCIFIYLTHDLNFASSRATAKKVWIRSFTYPDKWVIEGLPETGMPEPLLMELLGSSKNILFCEGKTNSYDLKIYNLLFPEFTVIPVDSCNDVIHHTKAFNKIPDISIKAYGIIDSDHHGSDRITKLKPYNIYPLPIAEVENLFLGEEFLMAFAPKVMKGISEVETIKNDILNKLENDIEMQVAHFVSAKINYYFNNSHVSKGSSINQIYENYNTFTSKINIEEWAKSRFDEIKKIVDERDYAMAISIFNNKGLKSIVEYNLKITDFSDRCINMLQFDAKAKEILLKQFPKQLL